MNPKVGLLLFIPILILYFVASPITAQEAGEKSTTYKIEIRRDGSALWTVETRMKLESQADVDAFNLYKAQFNANKSQNLGNFSSRIITIVGEASTITGRSMAARDFDAFLTVTSAPTGNYGVISYKFNWTGFAETEGNDLKVGDVFAGGMYLSKDEALMITPPHDFNAKEAAPEPDEVKDSALIWYGMRGFAGGEPGVLFSQAISMSWIYAALGAIAVVVVVVAVYLKRKKAAKEVDMAEEAGAASGEKASEAGEETAQFTEPLSQSDEDLILDLLKKAGGEMYQSEIIEKTNFSKSKASAILSNLKAKGLILKIKKGRENLIRRVK